MKVLYLFVALVVLSLAGAECIVSPDAGRKADPIVVAQLMVAHFGYQYGQLQHHTWVESIREGLDKCEIAENNSLVLYLWPDNTYHEENLTLPDDVAVLVFKTLQNDQTPTLRSKVELYGIMKLPHLKELALIHVDLFSDQVLTLFGLPTRCEDCTENVAQDSSFYSEIMT